jgi:acyl-CoA synthetase (AMP-forming)/AMP-acid ligase II
MTGSARITDFLDRWELEVPDREALRSGERSWTWSALAERVRRLSSALAASGVQPGDRVAFLDKNHPACLEVTLACSLIGAANAVVNFRLAPDEIAYVVNDAAARVLFVGDEFASVLGEISAKLPTVGRVVSLGGDADGYEDFLGSGAPTAPEHQSAADDCFLQLYTSGTTGFPKGAMITHRSVGAHNAAAAEAFSFDSDTVNMVAMPLFHVGGTSWALAGMRVGARTVIVREVVPAAVLDEIERLRVTHAFFVPAVYGFFLQLDDLPKRDLSSLKCLGYGGAAMPAPLMTRCLETFDADFYQVYGMTEMSGVFSVLRPEDHRDPDHPERLRCAGRPIAGVEVKVIDPVTRDEVSTGGFGEFWVRSQQHMVGYWGNERATREALLGDDWLRTGDAGRVDSDGYLFLEDRVKDMIISGGENIYPAEVERVLEGHPSVADVAVIGVPDEKWGESVKAVVVVADGAALDEAELAAYCRARLAGYKCPKSFDTIGALPRNPTGKTLKRELRAPYWPAQPTS